MDMNEVLGILKRIGDTASRNEKEQILKENIANEDLKRVLEYTYNPYKVYGVGAKAFKHSDDDTEFSDIFGLLDYLLEHNTGTDTDKAKVSAFTCRNIRQAYWYTRIILKDLKIGITATTINKIWPGLVPAFDVMLAQPFDRMPEQVAIEHKIDGCRCIAIRQPNSVILFTRNGKKIEGFEDIERQIMAIPTNGMSMVFDGEIVGENYKDTMNKLFAKGEKKTATYMIFDVIVDVDSFYQGIDKTPYHIRKLILLGLERRLKTENIPYPDLVFMQPIDVLKNPTVQELEKHMKDAVESGFEGIMVKDYNGAYECKRSYLWQKMKPFESDEFRIIGYVEGEGKLQGMLGKVLVDVDGTEVGVGSGFSEEERKDIWANRDKYLGQLIEVQYQEKIEKTGSLRFPTVKGFRFDKE